MQKDVVIWHYNVGLAVQSVHIPPPYRSCYIPFPFVHRKSELGHAVSHFL